ncbi:MAG: hypothetical protein KDK36_13495, partial [Leptospiraceae bacterium]|nr:hypothetical protein [Leptospiraceae bacterium]
EQPAITTGLNFEAGLSDLIIQSIGNEPGNLPLLEFCLLELWKKQDAVNRGVMTISDYQEIGGVKGALVKHADEVFEGLNDTEKEKARRIFVQLVQPGQGTGDTRKIATMTEIGENNLDLVRKLADERLIVVNRTATGETTIEVVHEALIREWGRLQGWMNANRAFRIWQEDLNGFLKIWKEEPIDGNLMEGNKLAESEEWLSEKEEDLSFEQREFVYNSIENREWIEYVDKKNKKKRRFLITVIIIAGLIWWGKESLEQKNRDEALKSILNISDKQLLHVTDLENWDESEIGKEPYTAKSLEEAKTLCGDNKKIPSLTEWKIHYNKIKNEKDEKKSHKKSKDGYFWTSDKAKKKRNVSQGEENPPEKEEDTNNEETSKIILFDAFEGIELVTDSTGAQADVHCLEIEK